ncbi:MAG: hypothetical protein IKF52_07095 [Clostridia bacterium]|nr:hypothetical protein [Clostridia bacterium]
MFKNQKGITLVALVITIIVLLILAGVTIAMVVGDNGILTRSKQAKFEQTRAKVTEEVQLAAADLAADIQAKIAKNSSVTYTASEVETVLGRTLKDSGYTVTGQAISNTGATASAITVTYGSSNLTASAMKDWSATDKKLSYTFTVSGYGVSAVTEASTNNGGY